MQDAAPVGLALLDSLHQVELNLKEQWQRMASEKNASKDSTETREIWKEEMTKLTAQISAIRGSISALQAENGFLRTKLLRLEFKQPPPEILRMIFSFATSAPLSDAAICVGPNSLWCRTMLTKRSLMLVCKLWRNVGVEFMYQDIVLRRPTQSAFLFRTLQTPGNNYGHFISSLSLTFATELAVFDDLCNILGGIFSASPRIEQFSLVNPFKLTHQDAGIFVHDWSKVLTLLANSPSSIRLTHVKLAITGADGTLGFDPCLLNDFPNLTSLDFDFPCGAENVQAIDQSISQIRLRKLRHLRCSMMEHSRGYFQVLLSMTSNPALLPQLNMLTIRLPCFQPDVRPSIRHLRSILQVCGPQLTYLHLQNEGSVGPWEINVAHYNIQKLMQLCPKLEHLIVPFRLIVSRPTLSHPTLRYLDIWTPPKTWRESKPSLTVYRETCPNLISIRRLDLALSYRSTDLPIHLPPDTTFPPGVCRMTFGMSETSKVIQTSHKILRKETGYVFDYPPERSSRRSERTSSAGSEDSSKSSDEEEGSSSDGSEDSKWGRRKWRERSTTSSDESTDSDSTDGSSDVLVED